MTTDGSSGTTRYRVVTAAGRGAIAAIRITGPSALEAVDQIFRSRSGRSLQRDTSGQLRVGRIGDGSGDEVVVVVESTDPPSLEIQSHGGTAVSSMIQRTLAGAGIIPAPEPIMFGDDPRPTRASRLVQEAWLDLRSIEAPRAAEVLLDQVDGALVEELHALVAMLDEPTDDRVIETIERLEELQGRGRWGTRLIEGIGVAIVGRPNVGKSSLINALAGVKRSIVTDRPGTTRDVVELRTAIDGWPVRFFDTAGLRTTDDPLERQGIARTRQQLEQAEHVVVVFDRSRPLEPEDLELLDSDALRDALPVVNKVDLPRAWSSLPSHRPAIAVSARDGTGLDDLIVAISRRLAPQQPDPESHPIAVPFRRCHVEAITEALDACQADQLAQTRAILTRLLADGVSLEKKC